MERDSSISIPKIIPTLSQIYVVPQERHKGYAVEMINDFKNSLPDADKYPILAVEDPTPEALSLLRKIRRIDWKRQDLKDWSHDRFKRLTFLCDNRIIVLTEDLAKISKLDGITEQDMKRYEQLFNSTEYQIQRCIQLK